jgi:hypothetical protein
MDPKDVRRILDEVCADLDRRKAPASLLGRYARPVGLSLALGLGGVAGCGSDSPSTSTDAAPVMRDGGRDGGVDLPQSQDLYGATVDLRPVGPEVQSPLDTADNRPIIEAAADIYAAADRPPIDSPPDIYGAADRPPIDAPVDIYGAAMDRPILEAAADIYAATDRVADKPTIDGQAVDGDKID